MKILTAIVLATATLCTAQGSSPLTKLSGIVTDRDSGLPIDGATVSAVGGQGVKDEFTDSEGKFILAFSKDVKDGDIVRIRVQKKGYTVNDLQVAVSALSVTVHLVRNITQKQNTRRQSLEPILIPAYKIMPYDPPYSPGTIVAGIKFKPQTLDVRFYLAIHHAPIKNLDLNIHLVNTSGQLLSIQGLAQRTTFPEILVTPVLNGGGVKSIQVINDGTNSTLPLGATSPAGTLEEYSDTWRINCDKLIANSTLEFVLMVDRPYRTKMIEGFLISGSYEYGETGKIKTEKLWNITKFDDLGEPYMPTQQEVQAILEYKRPNFQIWGVQIDLSGNPIPPPSK